ncbi:MAG: TRAP transporter small permease subunit [Deltaproteobacteria bacterium]|nr:TRAP transporter small permease subunit [Deltaproteobacteria bacterium]
MSQTAAAPPSQGPTTGLLGWLRRFDDGVARGEAALLTVILVAMVLFAAVQAALRNLSQAHIELATSLLTHFGWIDDFLQLGTVWVAFLGASLASHVEKHIAIDALSKVVPPRIRVAMHGLVLLFTAVIGVWLATAFYRAIVSQPTDADFEIFAGTQMVHVCDAADRALADAHAHRPIIFCPIRSGLTALGVVSKEGKPLGNSAAAYQLVVPVMFVFMALRSLGRGIANVVMAIRNELPASVLPKPPIPKGENPPPPRSGGTDSKPSAPEPEPPRPKRPSEEPTDKIPRAKKRKGKGR